MRILHTLKTFIVFLTIFAWLFSDYAIILNLSTSDVDRLGIKGGVEEAEAAGVKKIEQQINIIDTASSTTSTNYVSDNSIWLIYWDS